MKIFSWLNLNRFGQIFFDAVNLLASGKNLEMPLSRNLSGIYKGLHELRLKDSSGQVRFFYFVKKGDAIYMIHAFKKKTQELPKKEIDLVIKRIKGVSSCLGKK